MGPISSEKVSNFRCFVSVNTDSLLSLGEKERLGSGASHLAVGTTLSLVLLLLLATVVAITLYIAWRRRARQRYIFGNHSVLYMWLRRMCIKRLQFMCGCITLGLCGV